jgi:hypothetical protein
MSFLRRLFGGGGEEPASEPAAGTVEDPAADEDAERASDQAVLRADDERLDEFRRRQLRYAKWAWRPPAQGGTRRADDTDSGDDGEPRAGEG